MISEKYRIAVSETLDILKKARVCGRALEIRVYYADKDYSKSSIRKGDVLFDSTLIVNGEEYTTVELLSGIDREYTTKIKK